MVYSEYQPSFSKEINPCLSCPYNSEPNHGKAELWVSSLRETRQSFVISGTRTLCLKVWKTCQAYREHKRDQVSIDMSQAHSPVQRTQRHCTWSDLIPARSLVTCGTKEHPDNCASFRFPHVIEGAVQKRMWEGWGDNVITVFLILYVSENE